MLVVLRQRPPEPAQLVSRMALGVLAVDLIPPRRMRRQLKPLTAEHGDDAARTPVVVLRRAVPQEPLVGVLSRRTSRLVDHPPAGHELAEGARSQRGGSGVADGVTVLLDRLPDRLPAG